MQRQHSGRRANSSNRSTTAQKTPADNPRQLTQSHADLGVGQRAHKRGQALGEVVDEEGQRGQQACVSERQKYGGQTVLGTRRPAGWAEDSRTAEACRGFSAQAPLVTEVVNEINR